MRTRTSPRNQDRLWRYLCGPAPLPSNVPPTAPRCLACRDFPNTGRTWGHCVLIGSMVYGLRVAPPCFRPRVPA